MNPQVVLVTGSSRGIGLEVARAFAHRGDTVVLNGRSQETLAKAAKSLEGEKGTVATAAADVSNRKAVFEMVERVLADHGRIDVMVNNAGVYKASRFLDYTEESWNAMMQVNVNSVLYCMQAVIPSMVENGGGSIINLASVAGRLGNGNMAAYNVSKAAVLSLTKCAAAEFAATGVRINAVAPGLVDTDMGDQIPAELSALFGMKPEEVREKMISTYPVGRFLSTEEIASSVLFLADNKGFLGNVIDLNGGRLML